MKSKNIRPKKLASRATKAGPLDEEGKPVRVGCIVLDECGHFGIVTYIDGEAVICDLLEPAEEWPANLPSGKSPSYADGLTVVAYGATAALRNPKVRS